jgi:hypothetical protein
MYSIIINRKKGMFNTKPLSFFYELYFFFMKQMDLGPDLTKPILNGLGTAITEPQSFSAIQANAIMFLLNFCAFRKMIYSNLHKTRACVSMVITAMFVSQLASSDTADLFPSFKNRAHIRTKRLAHDLHAERHSLRTRCLVAEKHAFAVTSFSFPLKINFPCTAKFLPIEIDVTLNNESKRYSAYLSQDDIIREEQENGTICRKIKQYQIDEKHTAIVVNRDIDIVETSRIYSEVAVKLFKEWEIFTLFLHLLNIYDEEHDKVYVMKTLTVNIRFLFNDSKNR